MSDASDVVTAGAPGDSTHLLRALLAEAQGLLTYAAVRDPQAIETLWPQRRGRRASRSPIGGTLDPARSQPLPVARHAASASTTQHGFGRTVVLAVEHMRIVITEGPSMVMRPSFYADVGLSLWKADIVMVKNFFPFLMFFLPYNRKTDLRAHPRHDRLRRRVPADVRRPGAPARRRRRLAAARSRAPRARTDPGGPAGVRPRMTLAALALIALVAFGTEGAIGFGGTVIAASLGAQLLPLDELLPAFVPLNLALSAWLLLRGRDAIAWRVLVHEIALPVALGAGAGLALFHLPAKTMLALGFGGFVAGLATLQLARPAARPLGRPARLALLVVGGIAHGLFGTGGPMIVYVTRRRLPDKRTFRATLAVLWLVLNVALLVNFLAAGLYVRHTVELGTVVALALIPGLWIGERVHRALDPARFERVVWVLLLAAGTALAVRSLVTL